MLNSLRACIGRPCKGTLTVCQVSQRRSFRGTGATSSKSGSCVVHLLDIEATGPDVCGDEHPRRAAPAGRFRISGCVYFRVCVTRESLADWERRRLRAARAQRALPFSTAQPSNVVNGGYTGAGYQPH